jgi:hypothetical protein
MCTFFSCPRKRAPSHPWDLIAYSLCLTICICNVSPARRVKSTVQLYTIFLTCQFDCLIANFLTIYHISDLPIRLSCYCSSFHSIFLSALIVLLLFQLPYGISDCPAKFPIPLLLQLLYYISGRPAAFLVALLLFRMSYYYFSLYTIFLSVLSFLLSTLSYISPFKCSLTLANFI